MTRSRLALGCALLSLFAAAPARGATPRDWDGDGVIAGDCSPLDSAIHPGAADAPDLVFVDSNCDGIDGDAAGAVWVAPTGDDAAAGTLSAPLATIQAAVNQAAASAAPVYVEAGTYTERVVLTQGVSVYGGYAADGSRSRANTVTVQAPAGAAEAIFASAVTHSVLQLVTVRGATPSAANGSSSYGLRAVAGSSLALIADDIAAGTATTGADGATGAPGGQGAAGGKGADGNAQENSSSTTTGASTGGAGGGGNGQGGVGGRGAGYGGRRVTGGQNGRRGPAGARRPGGPGGPRAPHGPPAPREGAAPPRGP